MDLDCINSLCRQNLFIFSIYSRSELERDPENNSTLSAAYLLTTMGVLGEEQEHWEAIFWKTLNANQMPRKNFRTEVILTRHHNT